MISVWLIDNVEGKTGTDRKDSCAVGMSITGVVGISLVHMRKYTRNIMGFLTISLTFKDKPHFHVR